MIGFFIIPLNYSKIITCLNSSLNFTFSNERTPRNEVSHKAPVDHECSTAVKKRGCCPLHDKHRARTGEPCPRVKSIFHRIHRQNPGAYDVREPPVLYGSRETDKKETDTHSEGEAKEAGQIFQIDPGKKVRREPVRVCPFSRIQQQRPRERGL